MLLRKVNVVLCCFEFFGKLSLPASPLFSIALCFLIVSHRWQIIPRIFRGFSMASIVFPISHHSVHYADNFPCSSPSHPPFFPVFFQRISWLNLRWAQLYVSLVLMPFCLPKGTDYHGKISPIKFWHCPDWARKLKIVI